MLRLISVFVFSFKGKVLRQSFKERTENLASTSHKEVNHTKSTYLDHYSTENGQIMYKGKRKKCKCMLYIFLVYTDTQVPGSWFLVASPLKI